MAEAILGGLLEQLLENVNSLIHREVHLFFGVKNDAEKLSRTLSTIRDVLEDAESRKIKDKSLANWLKMLKDAAYNASDALDEWALEAQHPGEPEPADRGCTSRVSDSLLSCLNLKRIVFRCKMGKRFKDIINDFDEIAKQRSNFHLSPVVVVETGSQFEASRETSHIPTEPKIYGRDGDRDIIIDILLGNVNRDENVSVCPIVGIGGLGKTTLAQSVYNDERVTSHFEVKIWVCVSDPFDVKRVLKAIIETLEHETPNLQHLDPIQNKVHELLIGKRYLLVLDDVWNENRDEWERLKNSLMGGAKGSSIIVTTRLDTVASITGTIPKYILKPLPDNDCWILFKSRAFGDMGEENLVLVAIGKQIVEKCKGVPLAIKSLGSLLSFRNDESHWKLVRDSEMWNLEENAESGILPALRLSYKHLRSQSKRCFAYCSIFPKDDNMDKDELIRLWIANGFIQSDREMELEDIGNLIFDELLWRSFFQDYDDENKCCKMHDLMHDLASSVMEGDCLTVEGDISTGQGTKTRHLTLICWEPLPSADLDSFLKTQTSLRSLIFFDFSFDQPPINVSNVSTLQCLRVLNLSDMKIETLPSLICHLKLLRYLNLSDNQISSLPESIHGLRSLQMLDLSSNESLETLPPSIGKLESLRYLNLMNCEAMTSLPDSIGKLEPLRYLNLECCKAMTSLPDSMGGLKNLGSLILRWCWGLRVLPETMRNMEKLRHLDTFKCGNLTKMPVGIGELTCLETLSWFVVGRCNDSGSISELKNLNNLRGELRIIGLENVRNVEEVKEAKLRDKQYLTELELNWETSSCDSNIDVLEAFCPLPPHLQTLGICGYPEPYLQQFLECRLSAICLKKFEIRFCSGIKCLPKLMIGIQQQQQHLNNNISSSSSSSSSSLVQLLIYGCKNLTSVSEGLRYQTSLQSLVIQVCPELELGADDLQHLVSLRTLRLLGLPKVTSLPESVQHLTMLQQLSIWICKNLGRLPEGLKHLTALQSLKIRNCHPELHRRCEKEKGQDWHIISHIPHFYNYCSPPEVEKEKEGSTSEESSTSVVT